VVPSSSRGAIDGRRWHPYPVPQGARGGGAAGEAPAPAAPRALPEGPGAFLFTDLEGSTRLLAAHPAPREAARRCHALLRATREAMAAAWRIWSRTPDAFDARIACAAVGWRDERGVSGKETAMQELRDKVAVVTGAAGGIGQALATRFAAEGMKVVLADVDPAALQQTEGALKRTGATALAVPTDVSRLGDVEALAQQTLAAFGAAHVLCNNAGVGSAGTAWETPLAEWERIVGVNLWGVIHGLRVFVPLMLDQGAAGGGAGHIVNTASIAGLTPSPFLAADNATKHAVVALSESLAMALEVFGAPIRVSVLCPGVVNTPIMLREQNVHATLQSPHPEAIAAWERLRD
jgi:NAD(P)-dependent dehydrogenase (short-subunit alcohol dehydrogenase family)